jgi:hypothetical protein
VVAIVRDWVWNAEELLANVEKGIGSMNSWHLNLWQKGTVLCLMLGLSAVCEGLGLDYLDAEESGGHCEGLGLECRRSVGQCRKRHRINE